MYAMYLQVQPSSKSSLQLQPCSDDGYCSRGCKQLHAPNPYWAFVAMQTRVLATDAVAHVEHVWLKVCYLAGRYTLKIACVGLW